MDKMQALHAFWSGFKIPAFDEGSVPTEEDRIKTYGSAFPYLTYEASSDDFGNDLVQTASLFYRSTSWADITAKEQEISDFIGRGGRMIAYDGGAMWLQKSTPWATRYGDPNDEYIKAIALNINVEFLD